MKYIKISLAVAALLTLFVSCTKRTFEPVLGDTKVQFVNPTMELSLTGQYHFVPIQMVEQSTTSALATVVLKSAVATLPDGTTREIVEREKTDTVAAEIIFTSKEVYIGPYDSTTDGTGLPYNNLEFRLPYYRDYQSVTLEFELVGNNLAENTSCVYTASKPAGVVIEGSYSLQASIHPTDPQLVSVIKIDDNTYKFGYFDTQNGDVVCTKDGNTLTLSTDEYIEYDGKKLYYRGCDGSSILDQAVSITFDGAGFVLDNGMFFGDITTGSGYLIAVPGDKAVKN